MPHYAANWHRKGCTPPAGDVRRHIGVNHSCQTGLVGIKGQSDHLAAEPDSIGRPRLSNYLYRAPTVSLRMKQKLTFTVANRDRLRRLADYP
jgi:hypothetical protein